MGIVTSRMYIRNEDPAASNHRNMNESKKMKRQSTGEDSSLMMRVFTDDLLLEVFLRLPHAQSFLRCAAVCKRWRYLLSSDGFRQRFQRHHRNKDHSARYTIVLAYCLRLCQLLFSEQSKALHSKDFVPPENAVIASVGDLLLLRPFDPDADSRYVVCNPVTRQSVSLPFSHINITAALSHGLVLRKNTNFFYVYKFDSHVCFGPNSAFPIEVFSSETGKWVRGTVVSPSDMPQCDLQLMDSAHTAANGVMYVPFLSNSCICSGEFLALDPFSADEPKKGYFVRSPPGYDASAWRRAVQGNFCCQLHKGRLRVTQCFRKKREFAMKIWELSCDQRDGNDSGIDIGSWVLLYDGALKRLANAKTMCVKGIHPNKGSVVFVVDNFEAVYEYDFELEKYEKVGQIQSELYPGYSSRYYGSFMTSHALLHPAWPTPIPKIPKI